MDFPSPHLFIFRYLILPALSPDIPFGGISIRLSFSFDDSALFRFIPSSPLFGSSFHRPQFSASFPFLLLAVFSGRRGPWIVIFAFVFAVRLLHCWPLAFLRVPRFPFRSGFAPFAPDQARGSSIFPHPLSHGFHFIMLFRLLLDTSAPSLRTFAFPSTTWSPSQFSSLPRYAWKFFPISLGPLPPFVFSNRRFMTFRLQLSSCQQFEMLSRFSNPSSLPPPHGSVRSVPRFIYASSFPTYFFLPLSTNPVSMLWYLVSYGSQGAPAQAYH